MESEKKVEDKINNLEEQIAKLMKQQSNPITTPQPIKTLKKQEETPREKTIQKEKEANTNKVGITDSD